MLPLLLLLLLTLDGPLAQDGVLNLTTRMVTKPPELLKRDKRQMEEELAPTEEPPPLCTFGEADALDACSWYNPLNVSGRLRWRVGLGRTAYWLGGPRTDHTNGDDTGGYIFFETSAQEPQPTPLPELPMRPSPQPTHAPLPAKESALLLSRNITRTGAQGLCLSFFFLLEGLSAEALRVVLRDGETGENVTLWESRESQMGLWTKAELAYTHSSMHVIIFEAVPKQIGELSRTFRGYAALDDINFQPLEEASPDNCLGHCTFEGGFCEWTNMDGDDFDWELGRSSQSFLTGPSRDFSSFGKDEQTGGFAYIDASFPRRPGDVARLISPMLEATGDNNPFCMKFATHMFGNGIGRLRVFQRQEDASEERLLWEISGEAGNNWYTAQLPVASPAPYEIILEASIGPNSLGNIAIDSISFREGTCPVTPQAASLGSGDCNFEEDTCGWSNPPPQDEVDDFDWARQYSYTVSGPELDHTKGTPDGHYMTLLSGGIPQRGGSRAWLVSPTMEPRESARCLCFHYFMHERTIDPAGPGLGSLRVYVREEDSRRMTLLLRLNNHQGQRWLPARAPVLVGQERAVPSVRHHIIFEGIWGDGRIGHIAIDDVSFFDGECTYMPSKATSVEGECSFERDLCGWINESTPLTTPASRLSPVEEPISWRLATMTSKPAGLQDHSYRSMTGYVFFDVFNQASVRTPALLSPEFGAMEGAEKCLSFWFATFGRGERTTLRVSHVDEERDTLVWRLASLRRDAPFRPEWTYGQVAIDNDLEHRIKFEGEATDGGFALDDITFYDGACQTRPEEAAVGPAV